MLNKRLTIIIMLLISNIKIIYAEKLGEAAFDPKEVIKKETIKDIRADKPVPYWYNPANVYQGRFEGALKADKYQLRLTGFIRSEVITDSRAVAGIREDFAFIFPLPPDRDACCRDLNGLPKFHMFSFYSRMRLALSGIKVKTADVYGVMEFDFIGSAVINQNGNQVDGLSTIHAAALRLAYIRADWEWTSILFGQSWHPIIPPESPSNNSISVASTPFEAFSRNPQFRITHWFNEHVELIGALLSQSNFKSNGPLGYSTIYLRRSMLPNLHLQTRLHMNTHVLGVGIDFKREIPRNFTQPTINGPRFKTTEAINSYSVIAYTQLSYDRWNWIGKITYGQNLIDSFILSGYGVTSINSDTGRETYTPLAQVAFITEWFWKGSVEPGIIFGITKNVGTQGSRLFQLPENQPHVVGNNRFIIFGAGNPDPDPETGLPIVPGTIVNGPPNIFNAIDYVVGVAPRVKWNIKPVTIGVEFFVSRAIFGQITPNGTIEKPKQAVNNFRFILAAYYYF